MIFVGFEAFDDDPVETNDPDDGDGSEIPDGSNSLTSLRTDLVYDDDLILLAAAWSSRCGGHGRFPLAWFPPLVLLHPMRWIWILCLHLTMVVCSGRFLLHHRWCEP